MDNYFSASPRPDSHVAVPAAAAVHNVSHQLFSSPEDFLTTLQSLVSPRYEGQNEYDGQARLQYAAESGADEKSRAAASIALRHYDELRGLADISFYDKPDQHSSLTSDEIGLDLDMLKGNTHGEFMNKLGKDGFPLVVSGGASAAMVAGMATSWEIPPVFGMFGFGLVTAGVAFSHVAVGLATLPGAMKTKGLEDRRVINSWLKE